MSMNTGPKSTLKSWMAFFRKNPSEPAPLAQSATGSSPAVGAIAPVKILMTSEELINLWETDKGEFLANFERAISLPMLQRTQFFNACIRHTGPKETGESLLERLIKEEKGTLLLAIQIIYFYSKQWQAMENGCEELILNCLRAAVEGKNELLAKHLLLKYNTIDIDRPFFSGHSLLKYYVYTHQKKKIKFLSKLIKSDGRPYFPFASDIDLKGVTLIPLLPAARIYGLPWEGPLACLEDEYEDEYDENKGESVFLKRRV